MFEPDEEIPQATNGEPQAGPPPPPPPTGPKVPPKEVYPPGHEIC